MGICVLGLTYWGVMANDVSQDNIILGVAVMVDVGD
jgi:hypothetical protein